MRIPYRNTNSLCMGDIHHFAALSAGTNQYSLLLPIVIGSPMLLHTTTVYTLYYNATKSILRLITGKGNRILMALLPTDFKSVMSTSFIIPAFYRVNPTGFEPVTRWLKASRSTTELRVHNFLLHLTGCLNEVFRSKP